MAQVEQPQIVLVSCPAPPTRIRGGAGHETKIVWAWGAFCGGGHPDLTMAAAVGVSDLLASAFSSTLGSTVVTYDQYQKDKDSEKDEPVYYQALDVD